MVCASCRLVSPSGQGGRWCLHFYPAPNIFTTNLNDMKKQANVLIAMALAFATLTAAHAVAENPAIVRINKGEAAKTIDIQLANLRQHFTSVVLQDMEGKYWYSESIWHEDGYSKRLDLNGMPTGHYLCLVKNRGEFFTRSFRLDETDLVFYESAGAGNPGTVFGVQTGSQRPALVRITAEGANTVRLQLANLQEQPVLAQLNIPGDAIVYQQKVNGEQAFAKNINMDGMAAGMYFLYLTIGDAALIQFMEYSPAGVRLGALEHLDKTPPESAGLARK